MEINDYLVDDYNDIIRMLTLIASPSNNSDDGCSDALDLLIQGGYKTLIQHKAVTNIDEKLFSWLFMNYCEMKKCSECPIKKFCATYATEQQNHYDAKAPVMVDLFCGAGGLSLGFTQSGFRTSLANDIESCCVETYAHNHPEIPRKHIVMGDIEDVLSNIEVRLRFQEVDIIVGGPPCQGFSMANRQRLIDDPRNKLYKSYVKAVSIIKPRFFVMENVKGMLSVANQVVEDF